MQPRRALLAQLAKRLIQYAQGMVNLVLIDVQRGSYAEHVAIGSALPEQEPITLGQLHQALGALR
ncbi:MAG TPA: hypothetical protein VGH22_09625, partial [Candidatus Binatia bacterium]